MGGGIFNCRFEQLDRITTGPLPDQAEGIGKDALRRGLLAVFHEPGHEHRCKAIVELRIREDRTLDGGITA